MTEEELKKHEEFLIKEIEFYTGRKLPKVDEKLQNMSLASLDAWDKAGRPFDESELKPSSDTPLCRTIGPAVTQSKRQ